MKKRKDRSFRSLDEITKAYLPSHRAEVDSRIDDDPVLAGEALAERLIKNMRAELARRLRRR